MVAVLIIYTILKSLVVYLKQYFNADILRGGGKGRAADRGFRMPKASTNKIDYDNLIENLKTMITLVFLACHRT